MTLEVRCPNPTCHQPVQVPEGAAEEAVVCPFCHHSFHATENGQANGKLPPDLVEWARQTFNEAEFMAGVREIRESGGLQFEEFIGDLERAAGEHE